MVETNLLGCLFTTRAAMRHMGAQPGGGHIFHMEGAGSDGSATPNERRAVLRQSADARGVFLSDDVMDFMLTRFSRDLGSLMELLGLIDAYALQTKRAITIPLIKSMMEES